MVEKPSRRQLLAASGITLGGLTVFGVTAQQNENDFEREQDWEGQGSEHAEQDCSDSEEGFWHWILTPGGSTAIETEAELVVRFEDGSDTVEQGYRPSGGEQGAVHFDVTKPGGGIVESATVFFNGGGDNTVLTISDGECRPDGENGNGDGENGDGENGNGENGNGDGENGDGENGDGENGDGEEQPEDDEKEPDDSELSKKEKKKKAAKEAAEDDEKDKKGGT